jgi:hypothetical protein
MRRNILWSLLLLLICAPAFGETWYVRKDGGTRYSAKAPTGQCDGKADAAYRGRGVNQHCAFKDYRYLWDDQSYGNDAWVIAGGDTVILRGGPWRVGFDAATGKGAGLHVVLRRTGAIRLLQPRHSCWDAEPAHAHSGRELRKLQRWERGR